MPTNTTASSSRNSPPLGADLAGHWAELLKLIDLAQSLAASSADQRAQRE
jgi:hypothetical protein